MATNEKENKNADGWKKASGNIWKAEKVGDIVEGTVLGKTEILSDGEIVPYLIIQQSDGTKIKLPCGSHQLKEMLLIEEPDKGDYIAVRYDGVNPKVVKKNNPMKEYSYKFERDNKKQID